MEKDFKQLLREQFGVDITSLLAEYRGQDLPEHIEEFLQDEAVGLVKRTILPRGKIWFRLSSLDNYPCDSDVNVCAMCGESGDDDHIHAYEELEIGQGDRAFTATRRIPLCSPACGDRFAEGNATLFEIEMARENPEFTLATLGDLDAR